MKRSLEQNDILHVWCREILKHLLANGVWVTEETVKELILLKLGNTREVLGEKVAMRSSKYKRSDFYLTDAERRAGIISMDTLLNKIDAWASHDLGLILDPAIRAMMERAA